MVIFHNHHETLEKNGKDIWRYLFSTQITDLGRPASKRARLALVSTLLSILLNLSQTKVRIFRCVGIQPPKFGTCGGFLKMGVPRNMYGFFHGKSYNEMDENWGYPHFRKQKIVNMCNIPQQSTPLCRLHNKQLHPNHCDWNIPLLDTPWWRWPLSKGTWNGSNWSPETMVGKLGRLRRSDCTKPNGNSVFGICSATHLKWWWLMMIN